MFSGKDASNPSYPTQWALNPTAYQNVDSSQVDWAALAQQWIAMKEAAAIVSAPAPPPPKIDAEEGEAPMEVENPDTNNEGSGEWNSATNSWGTGWNQWSWGWPGAGPVDPKMTADSNMSMGPMMDGYTVPPDAASPISGYTSGTVPPATFQHGYWTAPQGEQSASRGNSTGRDRRSKSKNRDKPIRHRPLREKMPVLPPVIEPVMMPAPGVTTTIDAAKRRQLPAWIREGLEKMEREKQKALEREQENKAREEAERENKRLEEEELKRLRAEAGGQPALPPKSKFDTDSEGEGSDIEERKYSPEALKDESPKYRNTKNEPEVLGTKSKEELMQELMLAVRRSLTEILLEVTDQEVVTVSQEELARYTTAQASRLNAAKAGKSKAFAAIASGLGLGAYESSSEGSDEDDTNDISDHQLQELIKRKREEFERTSRDIEAEVRRAEVRDAGAARSPGTPAPHTPPDRHTPRSSVTPPPIIDSETPEKILERRLSKDRRNNYKSVDKLDGVKKSEVLEEKSKKSSRKHTPSPQKGNHKASLSTSSDSDKDSSSNSSKSSSESEPEVKEIKRAKKHKRRSSSEDSRRKTKKQKKEKSHKDIKESKSRHHEDDREKSRKKRDDYDKYKSRKDYDRHRDKYREESEERSRRRSRRSRSVSYRDRDGKYDRHDKYDRYDRYDRHREYDRRRSRSRSRQRR